MLALALKIRGGGGRSAIMLPGLRAARRAFAGGGVADAGGGGGGPAALSDADQAELDAALEEVWENSPARRPFWGPSPACTTRAACQTPALTPPQNFSRMAPTIRQLPNELTRDLNLRVSSFRASMQRHSGWLPRDEFQRLTSGCTYLTPAASEALLAASSAPAGWSVADEAGSLTKATHTSDTDPRTERPWSIYALLRAVQAEWKSEMRDGGALGCEFGVALGPVRVEDRSYFRRG